MTIYRSGLRLRIGSTCSLLVLWLLPLAVSFGDDPTTPEQAKPATAKTPRASKPITGRIPFQSAANFLPEGALLYVEGQKLGQTLAKFRQSEFFSMLQNSPQYEQYTKSKDYKKLEAGKNFLESNLQVEIWETVETILGKQIAVAVYPRPGRKEPDAFLVMQVGDASLLQRLQIQAEGLLTLFLQDRVSMETGPGNFKVTGLDNNLFYTVSGDTLLLTTKAELLERALESVSGTSSEKNTLATTESFRTVAKQSGDDHLVRLYVNTALARSLNTGNKDLPKSDNPVGSILAGGFIEAIMNSPAVGIWLDVNDAGLDLSVNVAGAYDQLAAKHRGFFGTPEQSLAPPIPKLESIIFGLSMYRNLQELYHQKEEILRDDLLPKFDKFESDLGNFLPGKDFSQDVLPLMGETFTLLLARHSFEELHGAKPSLKLPALAFVFDLKEANAQKFTEMFRLFFQGVVFFVNFTSKDQNGQPLVPHAEDLEDVNITYWQHLETPMGEELSPIYNFCPATALVNNRFVFSTSLGFCRELVRYYSEPVSEPVPLRNTEIVLNPDQVAAAIDDNRSLIVARGVQEGKTLQQSEKELDTVLQVIRKLQVFEFQTLVESEGVKLRLEVDWK